jgi:hypothetical protein
MANDPQAPWIEAPNTVLAGPASGSDNKPSGFRALVAADLPAATQNAIAGLVSGIRIAASSSAITSSSAILSGLTTITSVVVSLGQAASSGAYLATTSALASSSFLIQVWALTSSGSATPAASGVSAIVNWVAVGT